MLDIHTKLLYIAYMNCYVYIITNFDQTTIYVGVTSDLEARLYQHKNKLVAGFSAKYNCCKLVYFEHSTDMISAIAREKQIKRYSRLKKDALINSINPEWNDLSEGW